MFNRKNNIQDTATRLSDLSSARAGLRTLKEVYIRKNVEYEHKFGVPSNMYPKRIRETEALIERLQDHSNAIMDTKFYQKNSKAIRKLW